MVSALIKSEKTAIAQPKLGVFDKVRLYIPSEYEGELDWDVEGYVVGVTWLRGEWHYTVDCDTPLPRLISGVSGCCYQPAWEESALGNTLFLLERYDSAISFSGGAGGNAV